MRLSLQPTHLVVEQHGAPGLEQVLIDEGQHADVVLGPDGGGDDGVVVVDHLLQRADRQGAAAQVLHLTWGRWGKHEHGSAGARTVNVDGS